VIPEASAAVEKGQGNTNTLTVTVVEKSYDNTIVAMFVQSFKINNNASDVYQVGPYKVYVATSGNNKVTLCYILD